MRRALLSGVLFLVSVVLPACGPARRPRPELTEEEYRLYRGTGEDIEEQEDQALFAATAVGLVGPAQGPAPLLAASVVVPDRPMYVWNVVPPPSPRLAGR
jgi:hypothetical protein